MGKLKNNQSGFGTVEILLVIVIIALLGVTGWFVYKDHHKTAEFKTTAASTSKAATSTKATTTPAQPAYPYAGWKSYTSSYQDVSFQYPSTWTLKTQSDLNASAATDVTLASPNNLVLTYTDDYASGRGPCQPDSPIVNLSDVTQVTTSNSPSTMYLVQSGNEMALDDESTPTVGSVKSCNLFLILTSTTQSEGAFSFGTDTVFPSGTPTPVPSNQTQDFATAKLILESLKYKG